MTRLRAWWRNRHTTTLADTIPARWLAMGDHLGDGARVLLVERGEVTTIRTDRDIRRLRGDARVAIQGPF